MTAPRPRLRPYARLRSGLPRQRGDYDRMCMENMLDLMEVYPEVTGKDPRPLMECSVHTLVTDVIEVAADGQSARGCYITPGVIHSRLTG